MSYDDKDKSIDDAAPVNLYALIADGIPFFYTDDARPQWATITLDGVTTATLFASKQIDRTDIEYSSSLDDDSKCDVILPENDPVAMLVNGIITPQDMTVTIWEMHLTDPDAQPRQIYVGKVTNISTDGRQTTFSAVSLVQTHMESEIPNVTYSRTCNHKFGSTHCGYNREQTAHTGLTVAGFGVWDIQLSGAVPDENAYVGGTVLNNRTGAEQDVAALDGTELLTLGGFLDIAVGDPLTFFQACAHTFEACGAYDNQINFGGFMDMPRKNPFVQGFGELTYIPQGGEPT